MAESFSFVRRESIQDHGEFQTKDTGFSFRGTEVVVVADKGSTTSLGPVSLFSFRKRDGGFDKEGCPQQIQDLVVGANLAAVMNAYFSDRKTLEIPTCTRLSVNVSVAVVKADSSRTGIGVPKPASIVTYKSAVMDGISIESGRLTASRIFVSNLSFDELSDLSAGFKAAIDSHRATCNQFDAAD